MDIEDILFYPSIVARGDEVSTSYTIMNTDIAIQTVKGFFIFTDPNDTAVCGFNIPVTTIQSKGSESFFKSCRIPIGATLGQYRFTWNLKVVGEDKVKDSGSGPAFVVENNK